MRIFSMAAIIAVIFVAGCSSPQQPSAPVPDNTDSNNAAQFQCSGRTPVFGAEGVYVTYFFGSSDNILFVTEPTAFLAGAGILIRTQGSDLGSFAMYSDKAIIKDGKIYYTSNEPCWPKGKGLQLQGNVGNLLYTPEATEEQLQLRVAEYDKSACACNWVSEDMSSDKIEKNRKAMESWLNNPAAGNVVSCTKTKPDDSLTQISGKICTKAEFDAIVESAKAIA